jgi:hypothetical protein
MRTSSRSRRRSSPFSSIQSNAYRKTLASWHRWRIRSKLGTPRSRRKPHPPAGRRSARGQRMPGATHVPLTVAQKSRRRVFYVGRPFGHYCPLKYAGAAQAQSPGEKGGRARLSGGKGSRRHAPGGSPSCFPPSLLAARLQSATSKASSMCFASNAQLRAQGPLSRR